MKTLCVDLPRRKTLKWLHKWLEVRLGCVYVLELEATVMFLKIMENDSKCEILKLVVIILEDFFSDTAL